MKEKVLVFINYYGKLSETFITDELEFLRKQENFQLEVLHYGENILEKNIYGLGFHKSVKNRWLKNLLNIDLKTIKSLKYRNGINGSLLSLIPFFKKNQYDTIYCHFGTNGKLIAQLKSLGVIPKTTRIVIRFHGLDMLFSKYPVGYYDILNSFADKIIVGSSYAYQDLLSYKINSKILFKIPVGIKNKNISVNKSDSTLSTSGLFNIISIGRLVDFKGHLIALEIMKKLDKKGVDFFYTIIGDGPQFCLLRETIKNFNLKNKVLIVKGLEHFEVLKNLKSSHIYLYSGIKDSQGRAETQGLANLEAMANGLVIVASDVGGVSDYVIPNKTGFLCETGNINEFAGRLFEIMNDFNTESISEIRRNAVEMVQSNYCQEDLNKKLLNLLTE